MKRTRLRLPDNADGRVIFQVSAHAVWDANEHEARRLVILTDSREDLDLAIRIVCSARACAWSMSAHLQTGQLPQAHWP